MKATLINIAGAATLFTATTAYAEATQTGKDRVDNILSTGPLSCLETALRKAVQDDKAKISWKETKDSDGSYSRTYYAISLKKTSISRLTTISANFGISANNDSVLTALSSVGAVDLLNKNNGSLSALGVTAHFNTYLSYELAEISRPAEVNLHHDAYKCLYGVKPGEYPTRTLDPI